MKTKKLKIVSSEDYLPYMLKNRHALVLRPAKPFVRWHNKINSWKSDDPMDDVTAFPFILLFSKNENETYEKWIRKNYKRLFEEQLHEWVDNKKLWPKNRTYKLFQEWFELIFTHVIIDENPELPIKRF